MRFLRITALALTLTLWAARATAQQQTQSAPMDIPQDMKPYFLVIYRPGSDTMAIAPAANLELQRGHLAYLRSRIEEKKYIFAGPMTDGGAILGMLIMVAPSIDDARRMVEGDPMIRSHRMSFEIHPALLPSLSGVVVRY